MRRVLRRAAIGLFVCPLHFRRLGGNLALLIFSLSSSCSRFVIPHGRNRLISARIPALMNTLPRTRNSAALNRLNGGSAARGEASGAHPGASQAGTRAKTYTERIDITTPDALTRPRALWPLVVATCAALIAAPVYLALLDVPLIRSTAWPMFLLVGIGAIAGAIYARRDDRLWVRLTGSANVGLLALACLWFFWLASLPKASSAAETLTVAPDFQLPDQDGRQIALSNLTRGGPVLLVFYRGSWCPFCVSELKGLSGISEEMQRLGVRIVAVSVDPQRSAQQAAAGST